MNALDRVSKFMDDKHKSMKNKKEKKCKHIQVLCNYGIVCPRCGVILKPEKKVRIEEVETIRANYPDPSFSRFNILARKINEIIEILNSKTL
jgi:hypothetical protein